MTRYKALGCHVFAGGFTHGVQNAGWDVVAQLETHNFGLDTARERWGVDCINHESADWPTDYAASDVPLFYGNPRCTAFSTVTSGARYTDPKSNAHGPWAKQTCDVHQLVDYGVAHEFPFIVWESVQQAYTGAGRELIDWLVANRFEPSGYRVAHVFLNAATFGNAQQRKRYFMVAYKRGFRFNAQPPMLQPSYNTLFDAIKPWRDVEGRQYPLHEPGYDADCWRQFVPGSDEEQVLKLLPTGWCHNTLARYGYDMMPRKSQLIWDCRESEMPFSLHCMRRLPFLGPSPTMFSSCHMWVHPELDRCLTVGELSAIMGWPPGVIPVGKNPQAQLCKGVVPSCGEWLAQQIALSIEGHWGNDDWESTFCDKTGIWQGQSTPDALEKTIDMTRYCPKRYDPTRYEDESIVRHQFNIDRATGKVIRPWREIADRNAHLQINRFAVA